MNKNSFPIYSLSRVSIKLKPILLFFTFALANNSVQSQDNSTFDGNGPDIEIINELQAQRALDMRNNAADIQFDRDEDNVAIYTFAGDYSRRLDGTLNIQPRSGLAELFYQNHDDIYDFFVVFTTFEFETEDALAFYISVFNDTNGIGLSSLDLRPFFGNSRKIQGYIDMATLSRYELDNLQPAFDATLDTLIHEIMHRWGVHIRFVDAAGQVSTDLLGAEDAHWGAFVDSQASVMEGADWVDNGDGSFTAINIRHDYGPLDRYLAGFLRVEQVPPFFLIRGVAGDPKARSVSVGTTVSGTAEAITIDQVLAAEGPRIPSFDEAQREFRAAFILLKRPGEDVSPLTIAQLAAVRQGLESRFSVATGGYGVIHSTQAQENEAGPGDPEISQAPGPAGGPVNLSTSAEWLLNQQSQEGYWQDRPATRVRDTSMALRALGMLDVADPAILRGRDWLRSQTPANRDEAAWMLAADIFIGADEMVKNIVTADQNGDGGWGLDDETESSPLDTALVMFALQESDSGLLAITQASRNYLLEAHNNNRGWGNVTAGAPQISTSGWVMRVLADATNPPVELNVARDWLVEQQNPSGGFGSGAGTAHETALALMALDRIPGTEESVLANAAMALETMQAVDGSWTGSVYATALAVEALRSRGNPNLSVAGGLTLQPQQVVEGEIVHVVFTASNNGLFDTPEVKARLFLGDPRAGGMAVGDIKLIPALSPGEEHTAEIIWDTFGVSANAEMYVWIDFEQELLESSESDNLISSDLIILVPSDDPDLTVLTPTLSFAPATIGALPVEVQAAVDIRNLGTTEAAGISVVFQVKNGNQWDVLDAQTLDFQGRETLRVALNGISNITGNNEFRILADAENILTEPNENNNEARFQIAAVAGLDLTVTEDEVTLLTSNPVAGQDVSFRIVVRNQGTVLSPPVTMRVWIGRDAEEELINEQIIQIQPGMTEEKIVVFRPSAIGLHLLRVRIDADEEVAELNETNNEAVLEFSVAAVGKPNLVLTPGTMQFNPNPALEGQGLTVSIPFKNQSDVAAPAFNADLYEGLPEEGGNLLETTEFPQGVDSGATQIAQFNITALQGGGERLYYVKVDADDSIDEFNEEDNTAFNVVQVLRLPDPSIAIAGITLAPSTPLPGELLRATVMINNLGQQLINNLEVALHEIAADGSALQPVAPIVISAIAPGGMRDAVFEWIFSSSGNIDALEIKIDPNNVIAELDENNNTVRLPLSDQGQAFFTTERYISPNGDSVRDRAQLVLDLGAPESVTIVIRNSNGEIVRVFSGPELSEVSRGIVEWDGRNDRGTVVRDGDYSILLINTAGSTLGSAVIVVDTNRTPIFDAIGTTRGLFTDLRCSVQDIKSSIEKVKFSEDGNYIYTGFIENTYGQIESGLFRIPTRGSGLNRLLPSLWIQEQLNRDGGSSVVVDNFDVLVDGRIIFASKTSETSNSGCLNCSKHLWTKNSDFADPIELNIGGIQQFEFLTVTPQYAIITTDASVNGGNRQYHRINNSAGIPPLLLQSPAGASSFIMQTAGGILVMQHEHGAGEEIKRLWQIFDDPAYSPLLIQESLDGDININVSDDGRFVAAVAVPSVFAESPATVSVKAVRMDDGGGTTFFDKSYQVAVPSVAAGTFKAAFSPDNRLFILNANTATIEIHDSTGALTQLYELPTDLFIDYVTTENIDKFVFQFNDWNEIFLSRSNHNEFQYKDNGIRWSPDSGEFIVDFALQSSSPLGGEVGDIFSTRISQVYRIDPFSGEVNLVSTIDYQENNGVVFPNEIGIPPIQLLEWPVRTDHLLMNGPHLLTLRPTTNVQAIDLSRSLIRSWPKSNRSFIKKLYFRQFTGADEFECTSNKQPSLIYESADNLIAHLEANKLPAVIELSGSAADRDLFSYQLQWARVDSPGEWFAITQPIDIEIIDSLLVDWVPPEPGNYLIRLTASDFAGNSATDILAVSWAEQASLVDVQVEPRVISPNFDGVKDSSTISFRVLEPLNLNVTIENASGTIVRNLIAQFPAVTGETATMTWDGRDNTGKIVADGNYTVRVQERRFIVGVDTTPPTITLSLPRAYQRVVEGAGIRYAVHYNIQDDFLASGVLEVNLEGARREIALISSPGRGHQEVSPAEYINGRFRLSAVDHGGNRAQVEAVNELHDLVLMQLRQKLPSSDGESSVGPNTLDIKHFQFVSPDLISQEFPVIDTSVGGERFIFVAGSTFVEPVNAIFFEYADPQLPNEWFSLPADQVLPPIPEYSDFSTGVSLPDGVHLVSIPPGTLNGARDVLVRLRANINGQSVVSNGARLRLDAGIEIREVQCETGDLVNEDAALLDYLCRHGAESSFKNTQFWARESLPGTILSARMMVRSTTDARYFNATAFQPIESTDLGGATVFSAVLFGFPSAFCNSYQIDFEVEIRDPDGKVSAHRASGKRGIPCFYIETSMSVVVGEFCAAQPSNQVRITLTPRTKDLDDNGTSDVNIGISVAELRRIVQDESEILILSEANPRLDIPLQVDINTAALPVGQTRFHVFARDQNGETFDEFISLPIEHNAAGIHIRLPTESGKVCMTPATIGESVFMEARSEGVVTDDGNRIAVQSFFAPGGDLANILKADPAWVRVEEPPHCSTFSPGSVVELGAIRGCRLNYTPFDGEVGLIQVLGKDALQLSGDAALLTAVTDWSGSYQCAITHFILDGGVDVRLDESFGLFSPNGDGRLDLVNIQVEALEPLRVTVSIESMENNHLLTDFLINGQWMFQWAGTDAAGALLPDGPYRLKFDFTDDCGLTKTLFSSGEVDTMPPDIRIDTPIGGNPFPAIVQVLGAFNDIHFSEAAVWFGQNGQWNLLAEHDYPQPGGVIAQWNVSGLPPGEYDLRLAAQDRAFNEAEIINNVTVDEITSLIWALVAEPALFSPNGDGIHDLSRVELGVLNNGQFSITVENESGVVLRRLVDNKQLGPGSHNFFWDGRDESASVASDGLYRIVMDALSDGGGFTQTESITVTVDKTPPDLQILSPVGGAANANDAIVVRVNDLNLKQAQLMLIGVDPVQPAIELFAINQPGEYEVGNFNGFVEGSYRLQWLGNDRAGNSAEVILDFILDNTLPEARLLTPETNEVTGGAPGSVMVSGEIGDAHFSSYRLSLKPAGQQLPWQDLFTVSELPAAGMFEHIWPVSVADGMYELRLLVIDAAGNENAQIVPFVIDTTPPEAEITAPNDRSLVGPGAVITGTANDQNFQNYRLRVTLENSPNGPWSDITISSQPVESVVLHNWTNLPPDGVYRLQLLVTDQAEISTTSEVTVTVDAAPPAPPTDLTAVQEPGFNVRLQWQAGPSADVAGYIVLRNGLELNAPPVTTLSFIDHDVAEGERAYQVLAVDAAGNRSNPSNTVRITIDRTPPEVSLITPIVGARVRGQLNIIGTAMSSTDFFEYRLFVRNTTVPPPGDLLARSPSPAAGEVIAVWDSTDVQQERDYLFTLEAEDTSGNVATAERQIFVDNIAPAAPSGLVLVLQGDRDVQVNWNANTESDLVGYLLYRNGRLVNSAGSGGADLLPFAITTTEFQEQNVPDGNHEYTVFAIDQASNISQPSMSDMISIETGPPGLTIDQPVNGTRFEAPLFIRAVSDDIDIADVQFEWFKPTDPIWRPLGTADTAAPYETTFDPVALGLAFGQVLIRAVATDDGGLVDPDPPLVDVEFADLTPPDPVAGLAVQVNGGTAHLSWDPSSAEDLDGYIIQRATDDGDFAEIAIVAANSPQFDDSDLADAHYRYQLLAVDNAANRSSPSAVVGALAHTPSFIHPFAPTRDTVFNVSGISTVPGIIGGELESSAGTVSIAPQPTTPDGRFTLSDMPLDLGINMLTFRITDTAGNISKPGVTAVQRGTAPSAPQNPQATADGFNVTFSWEPPPEPGIIGYRLFRDASAILADEELTAGLTWTSSSNSSDAPLVGDTNAGTFWYPQDDDLRDNTAAWLETQVASPVLITKVDIQWSAGRRPLEYGVEAWSGFAWVELARFVDPQQDVQRLEQIEPYRSDRLRVIIHRFDENVFLPVRLAEFKITARALLNTTSFQETLDDGRFDYAVTAVNNLGFEGLVSAMATVEVGDVEPPAPVTLSGTVNGAEAQLSWTASTAPDLAEYRLFRNEQPVLFQTDLGNRTFIDAGLLNGIYRYFVVAVDQAGNVSARSNEIELTINVGTLPPPEALLVTPVPKGGALDLTWRPGPGDLPAAYIVRRALQSGGPYEDVATVMALNHRDTALDNGVTYFYVVHALDAVGNQSPPSNEAFATPRDVVAPASPVIRHPTIAGQPVTLGIMTADIAGTAEPGTRVEIFRNGIAMGRVPAVAETTTEFIPIDTANEIASGKLSPDGNHVFIADFFASLLFDLRTGQQTTLPFDAGSGVVWAADSQSIYLGSGGLRRFDTMGNLIETINDFTDADFAVPSPDAGRLFVAGDYHDPVTLQDESGFWLFDRTAGQAMRIGDFDRFATSETKVAWTHDGTGIAFAANSQQTGNFDLFFYDTSTEGLIPIASAVSSAFGTTPRWSPDDMRLAFAKDGEVKVFDFVTNLTTSIAADLGFADEIAWSPDGRLIAYGASCCDISLVDATTDQHAGVIRVPFIADMQWSRNGFLNVLNSAGLTRLATPGQFNLSDMPLLPGDNVVIAQAEDDGGNVSLSSQSIVIQIPATDLPDLAILSGDLVALPPDGLLGTVVRASFTLRNLGDTGAGDISVNLQLVRPDGSSELVLSENVSLPAGTSLAFGADLSALNTPGQYRLTAIVDPNDRIPESNETNNQAQSLFRIVEDLQPNVMVHTDRAEFAPHETVTGEFEIHNPGAPFTGMVQVTLEDETGIALDWHFDYPVEHLAPAQTVVVPFMWEPGNIFAGGYRVTARLFDNEGALLNEATADFSIAGIARFTLQLAAGSTTVPAGSSAALTANLSYPEGNKSISGASLQWTIMDSAENVVWTAETALPVMLPGFAGIFPKQWQPGAAEPGAYRLLVDLVDAGAAATAELILNVQESGQHLSLVGEIHPLSPVIALGLDFQIDVSITNNGNVELADLPVTLSLSRAGESEPLLSELRILTLPGGAQNNFRQTWPSLNLNLESYLILLTADLSAHGGQTATILASVSVTGVDGTAPVVTLISPGEGEVVGANVLVRALVVETVSAVAEVQLRLDGTEPVPLNMIGSEGEFQRSITGLTEGLHQFTVRAVDTWNNEVETSPRLFTVDDTPPMIEITGISDGFVGNQPVTPVIVVNDVHLQTTSILLDGQFYASGTTVTKEGAHLLRAMASDEAGHSTVQSVAFILDFTSPEIAVTAPEPGAVVMTPVIDITGETEADANITLTLNSTGMTTIADAQGMFIFPAAVLTEGVNSITLQATDRAGNTGPATVFSVTLSTDSAPALSGTLVVEVTDLARHHPLPVRVTLMNTGNVAFPVIPVRVHIVRAADQTSVSLYEPARGLARSEIYADRLLFDSETWLEGEYTAILESEIEPGVPVELGRSDFSVTDQDILFSDGFEFLIEAFGAKQPAKPTFAD